MQIVKDTLAEYGATLNDEGHIVKGGRVLSVRAVYIRYRLRFEAGGRLILSGPKTANLVRAFVKQFYFWEKVK